MQFILSVCVCVFCNTNECVCVLVHVVGKGLDGHVPFIISGGQLPSHHWTFLAIKVGVRWSQICTTIVEEDVTARLAQTAKVCLLPTSPVETL